MPASSQSTQGFIPIKEIRDGVAVLKGGQMVMVLIASSLNFALKSSDEQVGILLQYQNFLNTLDFSLQIVVQSRKLDIRPYLRILEDQAKEQTNDLLKVQTREYIEFVKNFSESVSIMTKSFFVVVPYSPPVFEVKQGLLGRFLPGNKSSGKAVDFFDEHRGQLEQRAEVVAQGLSRFGVRVLSLGTEELVELFFKTFNPGEVDVPALSLSTTPKNA